MANFVQPKAAQPTKDIFAREFAKEAAKREGIVEEVLVDEVISQKNSNPPPSSQDSKTITDSQTLSANHEGQVDEAKQTLSATQRDQVATSVLKASIAPKVKELDLVNNVSAPYEQEMEPDIDEEYQTL